MVDKLSTASGKPETGWVNVCGSSGSSGDSGGGAGGGGDRRGTRGFLSVVGGAWYLSACVPVCVRCDGYRVWVLWKGGRLSAGKYICGATKGLPGIGGEG